MTEIVNKNIETKNDVDLLSCSILGLRIILAIIFLYHGLPKALNWEMAMSKFVSMGFLGFLGPIIGIIEVIGAFSLFLGIKNRGVNIVLGGVILVAIIGVQIPSAISSGKLLPTGLERDLLMFAGHFILITTGAGKFKLKTKDLINIKKIYKYDENY